MLRHLRLEAGALDIDGEAILGHRAMEAVGVRPRLANSSRTRGMTDASGLANTEKQ